MVEDDDTLALALNKFQCFVFLKLKKKPVIIYVDFERNAWRYQRGNQKTFRRWSENTMAKKKENSTHNDDLQSRLFLQFQEYKTLKFIQS
jgi:hypothetical protein